MKMLLSFLIMTASSALAFDLAEPVEKCYGSASSPCIVPEKEEGRLLSVPYSTLGNPYDWQPFNCQYNGIYHPKPRGPGAQCNTTYFEVVNTIGGAALRGNMFSGDELKDSSDSGEGLKCAVTRMGSACNRLGFCDDYFPPRLEEYTLQMDFMISNYHVGFDHCILNVLGPDLSICYVDEEWWTVKVPPADMMSYKKLTKLDLPTPLRQELFTWHTWTVNYLNPISVGVEGFFKVSRDGVLVGSTPLPSWDHGYARRIELGVTTISPACATADYTFHMKNVAAYVGGVIPSSVSLAFSQWIYPVTPDTSPTELPIPDMSLYPPQPTLPTTEGKATPPATDSTPYPSSASSFAPQQAEQVNVKDATPGLRSSSSSPVAIVTSVVAVVAIIAIRFSRGNDS